jgi:hypothetical protein
MSGSRLENTYFNQSKDICVDFKGLLVNARWQGGIQALRKPFRDNHFMGDDRLVGGMCLECLFSMVSDFLPRSLLFT